VRRASGRGAVVLLLVIAGGSWPRSPSRAETSEDCLACHGDASLTMERKGRTVSLHVDAAALGNGCSAEAPMSETTIGTEVIGPRP